MIPRSPAARVGLPRTVAKPVKKKEAVTWASAEVDRFLSATADHRGAVAFRVNVLYGLRRSELLALKWDDLAPKGGLRIDEALSRRTRVRPGATPRTNAPGGRSRLTPTR